MIMMLFKGIAIGLLFGIPAGAVGAMTVQRTLARGYKAGLITGLGSSVADCLYAVVGAFGLTIISDFLLYYQTIINILGGILILAMGVGMMVHRQKIEESPSQDMSVDGIKMFLSSFAVGITNPATILTFLFAFSWFGIFGTLSIPEGLGLVGGVFIGTYCWWSGLTVATERIKRKSIAKDFQRLNRMFGIIMIAFAILIFARLCC